MGRPVGELFAALMEARGAVVCSGDCSAAEVAAADACGRLFVDAAGLGYVLRSCNWRAAAEEAAAARVPAPDPEADPDADADTDTDTTSRLIRYAAVMNRHGVNSPEAARYLADHAADRKFTELACTARMVKQVLQVSGGGGPPADPRTPG
jgi:hypothetical protein